MSSKEHFEFGLGQTARIAVSGETGEVIARADYKNDENSFLVRYKDATGVAVSKWWSADALEPAAE